MESNCFRTKRKDSLTSFSPATHPLLPRKEKKKKKDRCIESLTTATTDGPAEDPLSFFLVSLPPSVSLFFSFFLLFFFSSLILLHDCNSFSELKGENFGRRSSLSRSFFLSFPLFPLGYLYFAAEFSSESRRSRVPRVK